MKERRVPEAGASEKPSGNGHKEDWDLQKVMVILN